MIEVDGLVDARWAEWFDGQDVEILPTRSDPRHTTLIAHLVDQAALPTLLARVTGLNLTVTSVRPAPEGSEDQAGREPTALRPPSVRRQEIPMSLDASASRALSRKALRVGVTAFLVLSAAFFIPAGTLAYWQAWLYMGTILIPMVFVVRYLLRHAPELLDRRLRLREKEPTQIGVQTIGIFFLLLAFLVPGLDHRWGWSSVPVGIVIAADLLVLLGYGLIVRVFMENEYASRTVEVVEGQRVVTTGLYAIVRHPMYVGVTIFYLASPVALGSWWALLPAAFIVPMLMVRIVNEEQVLQRDLPGYPEYRQRVRYRLVPGVW